MSEVEIITADEVWSEGEILANVRHEKFAVRLAQGEKPKAAYAAVYNDKELSPNSLDRLPYALAKRPEVVLRVQQLRKKIADKVVTKAVMSEVYVLTQIKMLISKSSGTKPVYDRGGEKVGEMLIDGSSLAKGIDMAAKAVGIYREKRAAAEESELTFEQLVEKLRGLNEQEIRLAGTATRPGDTGSPTEDFEGEGTSDPGVAEEEP
jgi:hypothetical protein